MNSDPIERTSKLETTEVVLKFAQTIILGQVWIMNVSVSCLSGFADLYFVAGNGGMN